MTNQIKSVGPYSLTRWGDNLLFVSGQLPINQETGELERGIEKQSKQILLNIETILKSEDLTLDNVIKLTVLMKDLNDFEVVNDVFKEKLNQPYPARSTFEVSRLPMDSLLEIEAIALKDD